MDAYSKLIQDLCTYIHVEPWEQVARSGHVEFQGKVIGLVHDCEVDPEVIFIYIDLGPIFAERDPDIYRRMLVANLAPHRESTGRFCTHPVTGNAVYYMQFSIFTSGEYLADCLITTTEEAAARLHEIAEQRSAAFSSTVAIFSTQTHRS